jgi:hypothetical protein
MLKLENLIKGTRKLQINESKGLERWLRRGLGKITPK